jgi:hypothetical protein
VADDGQGASSTRGFARGQPVFSLSAEPLGTVQAVREDAFLLSRSGNSNVWVKSDAIFSVHNDSVQLICYGEGLARWCVEGSG